MYNYRVIGGLYSMDKIWRNLGLPLLIIIVGTFLYRVVSTIPSLVIIPTSYALVIIKAFTCFAFGMALKTFKHKKSSAWVGKLIISFVMFFYICEGLGLLSGFSQLVHVLDLVGLLNQQIAVPLIYTLCGYLFFD